MKLYLISQDKNNGYDTYSEAVVCANNEEEARLIHPNNTPWDGTVSSGFISDSWVKKEDVKVKWLGDADSSIKKGVVCASFNAG